VGKLGIHAEFLSMTKKLTRVKNNVIINGKLKEE
jgi:hypothetical protein